jgi:hypothetical protein
MMISGPNLPWRGISKHYAILSGLLNGGFDYAVYMTTARQESGSMSGAKPTRPKAGARSRMTQTPRL